MSGPGTLSRAPHTPGGRTKTLERERNTRDALSARERAGADTPCDEASSSPRTPDERVQGASEESFPASDPPGWIAGGATPCEEPK